MEGYKDAAPTALIPLDRCILQAQTLLDEIQQTTN
jgi:hypothetical protein